MQVICAGCGTTYELGPEYAGKKVRCRTCQAVIQVPAIEPSSGAAAPDWQAGPGTQPDYYGSQAGMVGGQPPYAAERAAAFETHRKLVGIFNILVGVLSLLWAGFCGLEMLFIPAMPQRQFPRDAPPKDFMIGLFFVLLLFSLIAGIIQLVAGTKILRGTAGARGMGILSGFVSCASLWGCCVYPFCLGTGVYTLIVLFGQDARHFLEVRRRNGPGVRGEWHGP